MKSLISLTIALSLLPGALAADLRKPVIYVPVLPYQYLFERIGGDWIEVHSVVGEGGDCHNYDPPPKQLARMAKANLLFSADLGFEGNFFVKAGDGITAPKALNLLEGLDLLEGSCEICNSTKDGEGSAHEHEHEDLKDPHIWLSTNMLRRLSQNVATILKEHTPAVAHPDIDAHLRAFHAELDAVHAELSASLAPLKGQTFYVYHGAFAYFAQDYGLTQKAIETYGRRPTPRQVAEIAKQARRTA